jgi:hypothetical protein
MRDQEHRATELLAQAVVDRVEKVAAVLLQAGGSILVAAPKQPEVRTAQVIELESAPGEIARPLTRPRSLLTLGTARAGTACVHLGDSPLVELPRRLRQPAVRPTDCR